MIRCTLKLSPAVHISQLVFYSLLFIFYPLKIVDIKRKGFVENYNRARQRILAPLPSNNIFNMHQVTF